MIGFTLIILLVFQRSWNLVTKTKCLLPEHWLFLFRLSLFCVWDSRITSLPKDNRPNRTQTPTGMWCWPTSGPGAGVEVASGGVSSPSGSAALRPGGQSPTPSLRESGDGCTGASSLCSCSLTDAILSGKGLLQPFVWAPGTDSPGGLLGTPHRSQVTWTPSGPGLGSESAAGRASEAEAAGRVEASVFAVFCSSQGRRASSRLRFQPWAQ